MWLPTFTNVKLLTQELRLDTWPPSALATLTDALPIDCTGQYRDRVSSHQDHPRP